MTYYAHVTNDGQVVLPADVARAIGLKPGDSILIERHDSKLVVKTYQDIVREGQDRFRSLLPAGFQGSLVDELIADRRAEAAAE